MVSRRYFILYQKGEKRYQSRTLTGHLGLGCTLHLQLSQDHAPGGTFQRGTWWYPAWRAGCGARLQPLREYGAERLGQNLTHLEIIWIMGLLCVSTLLGQEEQCWFKQYIPSCLQTWRAGKFPICTLILSFKPPERMGFPWVFHLFFIFSNDFPSCF